MTAISRALKSPSPSCNSQYCPRHPVAWYGALGYDIDPVEETVNSRYFAGAGDWGGMYGVSATGGRVQFMNM